MTEKTKPHKKMPPVSCDTCQYFDYDDETQDYVCTIEMDEDDMVRLFESGYKSCPYYKYYDEYTMVRKQN